MPDKKPIIAFCAHNDDHVIGAGGTLAKYSREGHDIITVIFSYGESTHPWLIQKEAIKMRVRESKDAEKYIGSKKLYYLGLKEGKFQEEMLEKKIQKKIKSIISMVRPGKIFTHSQDDPHPDHKAVYNVITEIMDSIKYNCDVYSFDIWNPISFRHRNNPKLFVDITKTFKYKIKAMQIHESQWMAKLFMVPLMYIRGLTNGLEKGVRYAEVFVKLR